MFRNPEFDGHERVVHACDEASGLRAIIAIHDTTLGPAFGGCRMWPYADEDAALSDVLRLSRGMTAKAAICDLPWGGGKAVIIGDPQREKTEALLKAMGRLVESLSGRYVIADDVGTTLEDLAVMRSETAHTAAATESAMQPWPVTAYGVLMAIEATTEQVIGRHDLQGLRVAVQGLGNVGMSLCAYLHERGAQLIVTDTDADRARDARDRYAANAVGPDEIFTAQADLFAPCALGAILDDESVPRLRVKAVCGGANNQLREPRHAAALAARGITFVPDYLASAGGVIDFHQESVDDSPDAVRAAVARIREITREVLTRARERGVTPLAAADEMVHARLTAARNRA
jgi:leucine dehydrogenase